MPPFTNYGELLAPQRDLPLRGILGALADQKAALLELFAIMGSVLGIYLVIRVRLITLLRGGKAGIELATEI